MKNQTSIIYRILSFIIDATILLIICRLLSCSSLLLSDGYFFIPSITFGVYLSINMYFFSASLGQRILGLCVTENNMKRKLPLLLIFNRSALMVVEIEVILLGLKLLSYLTDKIETTGTVSPLISVLGPIILILVFGHMFILYPKTKLLLHDYFSKSFVSNTACNEEEKTGGKYSNNKISTMVRIVLLGSIIVFIVYFVYIFFMIFTHGT